MSVIPEQVVLCRACVVECTKFKSLYNYKFVFNGKEETTYAELLKFISDIEFSEYETPSLPQYICNNCIQQLLKAYLFRKKVLDADELLKFELEDDGIDRNKDQIQEQIKIERVLDAQILYTNLSSDSNPSENSQPIPDGEIKIGIEQKEYQVNNSPDRLTQQKNYFLENVSNPSEAPETLVEITDDEYEENESQMEFDSELEVVEDSETTIGERRKAQMLFESEREIRMQNTKENIENPLEFQSYGEKMRAYIEENQTKSQCNICGKRFTYKNSYKYHMQFHFEGRKCHICNKTLKTYNEYLGHISTHVPNECKICGKLYRHASSLRTHMKTHTGELEIINCQLCSKSFTKKWNYQQHMLTHQKHMVNNGDEETPYKCEYCGRAYSIEDNLNYHRRKHCDMFKCVLCSQIFTSAKMLKDHMKLHPYDY